MPEQAIWKLISYESLNSHLLVSTEPDKEAEVGEILTQMVEEKSELSMESLAERKAFYTKTADFRVRRHWRACHLYYDVQHAEHDEYADHEYCYKKAGTGSA